ncbi:carbohydrate ABC transporter permease [Paenibacillus sp. MWE-103]|uniref:Carbohydrate ABC transporter permease n=1 Tax=Paenibacillus artemisiicola TaxID=1172618 RepID=A0ABS3W4D8_9BACL|nr:carbohydrate ABC transporter permease [Paenibacillus artemisiicola]MBO7743144.1 carbohydrate ABC transporter permease [Paenibacillus artemisiicola]
MENEVARVSKSTAISNRLQRHTLATITGNACVYGSLICLFIITFFPFWHIFVLSLNDASDPAYGQFMLWPNEFSLESYKTVLKDSEILNSILVTVGRTIVGVPLTLACISMLAYALSKRELVGWRGINLFFIFTMYFGGGLIPTYMIVRSLHLIDSFWVFIFPGVISVFWMILVRTYMEGLPKEMEEAAQMEGANDIQIFLKVILPVCTPVMATIALFSAISHWNAWYDSYIYTYAASLKTLSAVLVKILNQYQTNDMLNEAQQLANEQRKMPVSSETIRMAVTMVATLPIIFLYPLLQKYFLKGMLIGSVKG